MRRWILAAFACLIVCLPIGSVGAQSDPKNKGLLISPLRSYTSLQAGMDVTRSFKVANLTDKTVGIKIEVKGFSVIDNIYEFKFSDTPNNWVHLVENYVTLKPYETHDIAYVIKVPKNIAPGGHYYSFFVSTTLAGNSVSTTVRAANLLYLTVDGKLVRTSEVQSTSLPRIVVTPQVPYVIDVKNTGNIHYFAYVSARIDGLFYHDAPTGVSQLLMPGTTRRLEHTICAPLLPGVYHVTFGYTPDDGPRVERAGWILFVPPWFFVLVILLGFMLGGVIRHHKKRARKRSI